MREMIYVDPADLFRNWGDLSVKQQMVLDEEQYRKQMYSKIYGD